MRARKAVQVVLIAFVAFTLGVAVAKLVKEHSAASSEEAAAVDSSLQASAQGTGYRAIYFHATNRCPTCNAIERLGREIINSRFADMIESGQLQLESRNFEEPQNSRLAMQLHVMFPVWVITRWEDGRLVASQTLDKVWNYVHDPDVYSVYVTEQLRKFFAQFDKQQNASIDSSDTAGSAEAGEGGNG